MSSLLPQLVPAAPAVIAAGLMFKARYVTTHEHCSLLAIWCLGPWNCLQTIPWKIEWAFKLRLIYKEVKTLSADALLQQWHYRPTDVVVAAPPKSGTTWLLQIAHQLRMRGVWGSHASFDDQMDVIPWLEGGAASLLQSNDLNKEHVADPRVYKSHYCYAECPKQVKLIYCFRDLKDAVLSDWYFITPIVPSDMPLDIFATARAVTGGVDRALNDLCDWWEHRNCPNVCFFFFDDLKEHHLQSVLRLQRFMDVDGGYGVALKVVEQSTHDFMTSPDNHSKFDDHKIVIEIDRIRGYARDLLLSGKARKDGGASGRGRQELPPQVQDWIDWRWQCIVQTRLGFENLDKMREAWASELRSANP